MNENAQSTSKNDANPSKANLPASEPKETENNIKTSILNKNDQKTSLNTENNTSTTPKIIIYNSGQNQPNQRKLSSLSLDSMMAVKELPINDSNSINPLINTKKENTQISTLPVVKTVNSVPHCVVVKKVNPIKTQIPVTHPIIPPAAPKQIIDILVQNPQQPKPQNDAVVRVIRPTQHRVAALKIETPPPPAAPFPCLPTSSEVLLEIQQIEKEIETLREKCEYLEKEKEYSMISVPKIENAPAAAQVLDFHGVVFSNNNYKNICKENKKKVSRSHKCVEMPKSSITQQYKHISLFPQYLDVMDESNDESEEIFRVLKNTAVQNEIYNRQLTAEYIARKEKWEESNAELSDYHSEAGDAVNQWPAEFAIGRRRPDDGSVNKFCSKDLPMYLNPQEKEAMTYYDENMLVEDPVKEHEEYKNRLTWTDEEKEIFYDKYAHHTREFKKIAAALPMKSVKDVIEYYSIYRKKLNLHALDVAAREKFQKRAEAKHK